MVQRTERGWFWSGYCAQRLTLEEREKMFELHQASDPKWVQTVLDDFDTFLIDHAACERKASATAMSFVVRYPDRVALMEPMIEVAREELEHFHHVYRLIEARGLRFGSDVKDPYVNMMIKHVRNGREERFLDRLILGGVLEARGCERFGLIGEALPAGELKEFYVELARSEARHHGLFLRMARQYFEPEVVRERHLFFLDREAEAIRDLPLRSALH